MSEALAVRELDDQAVALITATYAKGCTPEELQLFIQVCNRTGLDPFARQIYAVKRYDRREGREVMTTQISIDGARLIAQRSREYAGQTPVWYCGEDGEWTDLWIRKFGPLVAAKVGVYRRGFAEPLWATATWEQYAVSMTDREGKRCLAPMWQQFGPLMLGKCAEMLALRKAFPMELSDLYTEEEMGQFDVPAPATDAPTHRSRVANLAADDSQRPAEAPAASSTPAPSPTPAEATSTPAGPAAAPLSDDVAQEIRDIIKASELDCDERTKTFLVSLADQYRIKGTLTERQIESGAKAARRVLMESQALDGEDEIQDAEVVEKSGYTGPRTDAYSNDGEEPF